MEIKTDNNGLTYDSKNQYNLGKNNQDNTFTNTTWEAFPSFEQYKKLNKEEKITLWKRARAITEECIANGIDLFRI